VRLLRVPFGITSPEHHFHEMSLFTSMWLEGQLVIASKLPARGGLFTRHDAILKNFHAEHKGSSDAVDGLWKEFSGKASWWNLLSFVTT